jgi:hypothetical protein
MRRIGQAFYQGLWQRKTIKLERLKTFFEKNKKNP